MAGSGFGGAGIDPDELRDLMNEARKFFAGGGKAVGEMSDAAKKWNAVGKFMHNVQQNPVRAVTNLMPGPVQPVVEMMIQGIRQQEEFRTATEQTMRILDPTVGMQKWRGEFAGIESDIKRMYLQWGSLGQEMQATFGAFERSGAGMAAFDKMISSTGPMSTNIAEFATSLDLLKNVAAGTTANAITESYISTGRAASEAADQVGRLAMYAEASDTNYSALLQTMVQGTAIFRSQNAGVGDVSEVYGQVRGGYDAIMPGAKKAAINARSMVGFQAAEQGIGNANIGWQARWAQQAFAKQGRELTPFQALGAWDLGQYKGNPVKAFFDAFKADFESRFGGRTEEEQASILSRTPLLGSPLGPEAMKALMAYMKGNATSKDLETLGKTLSPDTVEKLLNDGMSRQEATANKLDSLLRQFMVAVGQIGLAIVGTLVGGFFSLAIGNPELREKGHKILGGSMRMMLSAGEELGNLGLKTGAFVFDTVEDATSQPTLQDRIEAADITRMYQRQYLNSVKRANRSMTAMSPREIYEALGPEGKKGMAEALAVLQREALETPGQMSEDEMAERMKTAPMADQFRQQTPGFASKRIPTVIDGKKSEIVVIVRTLPGTAEARVP